MEFEIIPAVHFHPVSWSGGTTTELFIFPESAQYRERDFQFRISTAKVESDKSDFTSLKGVSRTLLILEGKITIKHEGHYSKELNKFDTDKFPGDWKTSSVGRCSDFNLMTTGHTRGELGYLVVRGGKSSCLEIQDKSDWFFMYVYTGKVRVDLGNEKLSLDRGDLLKIHKHGTMKIEILSSQDSELILAEITSHQDTVG
ncbi:MAG: HutD family protein [Bacteroidales bacterium]